MKLRSTLLLLLLATNNLFTQTCLPDGITITHQSTIDNFQDYYPGCEVILGDVIFDGIDIDVANVDSLYTVTEIQGNLIFGGYDYWLLNFESLEGFSNLTTIGGNLQIVGLALLPSLEGLENLNSIGGKLMIELNPVLEEISSLNSLIEINGTLSISGNPVLNSLNGIENIDPSGINLLYITYNDSISECSISNLCSYLELNTAPNDAYINNNLEGCNSIDEVLVGCSAMSIKTQEGKNSSITIVNPVKNRLNIIQNGFETELQSVKIISLSGKTIISTDNIISSNSIDVSHLNSGMYILQVEFENGYRSSKKFLINHKL